MRTIRRTQRDFDRERNGTDIEFFLRRYGRRPFFMIRPRKSFGSVSCEEPELRLSYRARSGSWAELPGSSFARRRVPAHAPDLRNPRLRQCLKVSLAA